MRTGRFGRWALWTCLLGAVPWTPARGEEPQAPAPRYDVLFEAAILPSERAARASIALGAGASRVKRMRFRIDPERHLGFRTDDGELSVEGEHVEWRPPPDGGTLRYLFRIDRLRDERSYEARCAQRWAIFRGGDLFPAARLRTTRGARSRSRLRLRLPEGWSAATPYPRTTGGVYLVQHANRRFDRPTGWFAVGELGVVREKIEGMQLSIAGPRDHGLRRLDILALFSWTLPTLREIFGELPERMLVVGAGDPMWRGGLSGPGSFFIHADRPLIGEDETSPHLHETVHSLLRLEPGSGGDWIVEGLAERYSLEVLRRSGTFSEDRYELALAGMRERAKRAGKLRVRSISGDTRARAVLVMNDLDEEIRKATDGARSLDDVVRAVRDETEPITTSRFQALAEAAAGQSLDAFFQRHVPRPAGPPAGAPPAATDAGPPGDARAENPVTLSEEREACRDRDPLRRPFFGDTHVHTAYSFDASIQDTRNTPRDAYRFARGEPLGIQPYDAEGNPQRRIQLARPLDFAAVTDHAELLGEVSLCTAADSPVYDSLLCRIHRGWPKLAFRLEAARTLILRSRWGLCGEDDERCLAAAAGVWRDVQAAAEEAYDRSARCRFTSFVGYEWTSTVQDGINLHRNVIFRNARVPAAPISWLDTPNAVDLWDRLEEQCLRDIPGCDAITIPHNSNLSAGLMFESATLSSWDAGEPIGADEARRRARWEPLIEIMQHKGDSECRLGAGTEDELCNFELLPYDRFGPKFSRLARRRLPEASNFVRSALLRGLRDQAELGENPFRYGIVASTDTHIAAPGLTGEKDHPGHGGAGLGAGEGVPVGFPDDFEFSPGGLAVLWAEENSRDSLFAAMQRREAYGTSGTRPIVRFFGGWELPENLCGSRSFARQGYARGVPMGGELPAAPRGRERAAPAFALWALRDPGSPGAPGTPLQRIQIVKGWLEDGELRERVVDVAGGENGASVDLATFERRGEGAGSLCSVWRDPEFDPAAPAFYYARVLENPSCRWSQYVCLAGGVDCSRPDSVPEGLADCCGEEHRPVIQERAWTSPIWYTPRPSRPPEAP